jgi:hypothetical protein
LKGSRLVRLPFLFLGISERVPMRNLHRVRLPMLFAGLLLTACTTAPAWQDRPVSIGTVTSGVEIIDKPVSSFQERKFKEIVRQQTDFSCGAAAVKLRSSSTC